MIQLTKTLKRICTQISRFLNARWSVSYFTLQSMGYIITSNPTAKGLSVNLQYFTLGGLTDGNRDTDKLPFL